MTCIAAIPFEVRGDKVFIGSEDNSPVTYYTREQVAEIVDFLQVWLDYDPEKALREKVWRAFEPYQHGTEYYRQCGLVKVIEAVREHDAELRGDA